MGEVKNNEPKPEVSWTYSQWYDWLSPERLLRLNTLRDKVGIAPKSREDTARRYYDSAKKEGRFLTQAEIMERFEDRVAESKRDSHYR